MALPSDTMMGLEGGETRLDDAIRNNPFAFYRTLRKKVPVNYDPGLDLYLVTRYQDAVNVLRDDVTYSLEHGYQDRYANGFLDEFAAILERDYGGFIRDLALDPPARQHQAGGAGREIDLSADVGESDA